MYTVYYDGEAISAGGNPHFAMTSAVLTQAINTADSFSFTLPATHPYRDIPQARQGIVRVDINGQTVFVGDVVEIKTAFDNSRTFECQGCLAWLNDVCNTKTDTPTTVADSFKRRMKIYNDNCAASRKMIAGRCTNKPTQTARVFATDEFITIFEYFSQLIAAKGGILMPRYEGGNIFLDYLDSTSRVSNQQIIFGSNLLNLDDFISMDSTATVIYPTGNNGLTVESVNPTGKAYIINNAMYNRYGMIATAAKFDTDDAAELYSQAKLTLSSLAVLNRSIKLSAFDLSLANSTVDGIEVGDSVQVISAPHELNTSMICTAKTTDLINPANCAITLGKSFASISGIVSNRGTQTMSAGSSGGETQPTTEFNLPITFNSSVTTKSEVEIYGATPHIDFHFAENDVDYTSRIIENAAGAIDILAPNGLKLNGSNLKYDDTAIKNRLTAIEKKENVTLTAYTDRISNVSYTAKYFQLLGIVFVRIYGKIKASLNAGYDYDLFSIDNRVPNSNAALSVKCGKNAMALAKTSDKGSAIQISPLESGINGYDVYITGFWFV